MTCACGKPVHMMDGTGSACSICPRQYHCSADCANAHYFERHTRKDDPRRLKWLARKAAQKAAQA